MKCEYEEEKKMYEKSYEIENIEFENKKLIKKKEKMKKKKIKKTHTNCTESSRCNCVETMSFFLKYIIYKYIK